MAGAAPHALAERACPSVMLCSIQFDGKHAAIDDLGSNIVYRLRFSGSNANIVGRTHLDGVGKWTVEQFWLCARCATPACRTVRLHDLRHSFATMALEAGVDL
jgi:hypothetical protein